MDFHHDWFSHNITNWQKFLSIFVDRPRINALEIGCYDGRATTWLINNILTHDTSILYTVDTFIGSEEHRENNVNFSGVKERFLKNIDEFKDKIRVFEGFSYDFLCKHEECDFDFAYVDGSHHSCDVITDICLLWPKVNPGGIVIFDDYEWDAYVDVKKNPRLAIDAFLTIFEGRYELIDKAYQVTIRKIV